MPEITIQQAFDVALRRHQAGHLREAEALYQQILAKQPGHAETIHFLGLVAHQLGHNDRAVDLIRESIALKPRNAQTHYNLSIVLTATGELEQAINQFRQSIELDGRVPDAHLNLGNVLLKRGRFDEAIAAHRRAIGLNPNLAEAYSSMGVALGEKGLYDESIAACRNAVAINPTFSDAYGNLGSSLQRTGQLDEAISAFCRAIAHSPRSTSAHDNYLYALHFHPGYDARRIAEEHARWNRQHAEPLRPAPLPGRGRLDFPNDRTPDRPLRIGYVSPDFRHHVIGRNLLPLFKHHDRRQVEIICYANLSRADEMTGEFQRLADGWRDISRGSDDQVAQRIRDDRIDILVDLSLHLAGNRLGVFARQPAPVQVAFAGYPASTGLSAIDYRLSDPYLDPPGRDHSIYSEQTVRLPDSFWCYEPMVVPPPTVSALPALAAGHVTFGCLNSFYKVNAPILGLWARVMRQVDNSRLLLLAPQGSHRQKTATIFAHAGVDPSRIDFVVPQPLESYLKTYDHIDVSLDSFPYNGHSTSLDSLWTGVPVVTLVGDRAVSRAGWCQLSNLGLQSLAAKTPEQYVQIAVDLARDLPRLAELRATLRTRMEQSPLMNAPKFARGVESAYRWMWRSWCGAIDWTMKF